MSSTENITPKEASSSKCHQCEKTNISLMQCAKCKTAKYCDRECQIAHWKVHKKECSKLAGLCDPAASDEGTSDKPNKNSTSNPFTAIQQNTFLHGRSEHETFKILIDVVRMRQEDKYTFEGDTMPGTIYSQERSSAKALKAFLKRAKKVNGLLPPWWTDAKTEECVRFGLSDAHGALLQCAQEKSDIQEAWKDSQMPMKLRMLGEGVYGNWPGSGAGGRESMLAMMMQMEGGSLGPNGMMSHLSLNPRRT